MPETILITGGSGFIGQHLATGLTSDYRILSPPRSVLNLWDAECVKTYLERERPDAIIHSAVQPGHRNAVDPTRLLERNCRMFFNLTRCLRPDQRMLFLSSGAAYGVEYPMKGIKEESFDRCVPGDEHGLSKYISARYSHTQTNILELRLFGIFGPGEDYLIRFISNAICKALAGLPITCRQDRHFSYLWVYDLIPILTHFLNNGWQHEAYNLVPPEFDSLVNLANRIQEKTKAEVPIQVSRPGLGLPYWGSAVRLVKVLPNPSFTPMDLALDRLVAHYKSRTDSLDFKALMVDK